ncbi:MAG: hypothetical protein ACFFCW_30750 [Candidatus Hodarchaeota archaeon]
MGCYDFVGKENIQIKLLDCEFIHYNIGDKIALDDGLYLSYEGWFVVDKGNVLITGDKVFSKWGNEIEISDIIEKLNPLYEIINTIANNQKIQETSS